LNSQYKTKISKVLAYFSVIKILCKKFRRGVLTNSGVQFTNKVLQGTANNRGCKFYHIKLYYLL